MRKAGAFDQSMPQETIGRNVVARGPSCVKARDERFQTERDWSACVKKVGNSKGINLGNISRSQYLIRFHRLFQPGAEVCRYGIALNGVLNHVPLGE
jgi:hypothetical protein